MKLKQVFTDDRAVSPVIGVILMVAITVILAAVIGTFVLGLGNNLGDTAPNANFDFDYSENDDDSYNVTATHKGGATINEDNAGSLNLTADSVDTDPSTKEFPTFDSGVSTGDSTYLPNVTAGSDVSVVWTSQDGSNSQALGEGSAPGN